MAALLVLHAARESPIGAEWTGRSICQTLFGQKKRQKGCLDRSQTFLENGERTLSICRLSPGN